MHGQNRDELFMAIENCTRVVRRVINQSIRDDPNKVDELTEKAILRAYENWKKFEGKSVIPWVVKIARNIIVDEWRKVQRRQKRFGESAYVNLENVPDSSLDQEMQTILANEVKLALEGVPEHQIKDLVRVYVLGERYEDIAPRDKNVHTFRISILRLRQKCKANYEARMQARLRVSAT